MAKWRRPSNTPYSSGARASRERLDAAKARVNALIEQGDLETALELLEPIEDEFPNDWEVLMMVGLCCFGLGDFDLALDYYEDAYNVSQAPVVLYPLGMVYLQQDMVASAMHAFNESARRGLRLPDEMEPTLELLRSTLDEKAREAGVPKQKAIPGFREMERAVRLIDRSDYSGAIKASRIATKMLGDWPPPHLDLAEALFGDGQAAGAIAELRQILARDPEHIHAASRLVRFLAWTDNRTGAEQVWQTMATRVPVELPFDAIDLAEAAAILDYDQDVRRFLLPLADRPEEEYGNPPSFTLVQRFLAIADANLGDPKSAKRRLQLIKTEDDEHAQLLRDALRSGQTSLGLNNRFSYYSSVDVLMSINFVEFSNLGLAAAENPTDPQIMKAMMQVAARYPQLVLVAEKQIWEEDEIDVGIGLLQQLRTPAAYAALRRFAGSRAGSDEERTNALMALQMSGGVKEGERFTMWREGEWRETALRNFKIGPRVDHPPYKAQVAKLVHEGEVALAESRWADGAALMRKVIALEPRAYEAYNNLAVALGRMGDPETGQEMLERALAINPKYVFARVSLATTLVKTDVAAAEAMLAPLETMTVFTPPEFLFYHFGVAQVAFVRGDYAGARAALQMAFTYDPEYQLAVDLWEQIEDAGFGEHENSIEQMIAELQERKAALYRQQQQAKLGTLEPTISDTVGIYSVELLRQIFRAVLPKESTSNRRKADLQRAIVDALLQPDRLTTIVDGNLDSEMHSALIAVLAEDGAMPREQFRARFGDDTGESPYWFHKAPTSVSGRLRLHCLLVETTVTDEVFLAIPVELRTPLDIALNSGVLD